jgi:hypothetical protein
MPEKKREGVRHGAASDFRKDRQAAPRFFYRPMKTRPGVFGPKPGFRRFEGAGVEGAGVAQVDGRRW